MSSSLWVWPVLLAVACIGCGSDRDRDGVQDAADRCPDGPRGFAVDATGCSAVEVALERGVGAMLAQREACAVGTLWALQQLLRLQELPPLRAYLEGSVVRCAGEPGAVLLDTDSPQWALPEDPGRGLTRFWNFVLAPMGSPAPRAGEFVARFVSTDEQGYVLTHQLLTLAWARQTGVPLPAAAWQREAELLRRIAEEQAGDPGFTDLFAERAAILLLYAGPDEGAARRWIDTIVGAQRPEGHWQDPTGRSVIVYDGTKSVGKHRLGHTNALALLALRAFLDRH